MGLPRMASHRSYQVQNVTPTSPGSRYDQHSHPSPTGDQRAAGAIQRFAGGWGRVVCMYIHDWLGRASRLGPPPSRGDEGTERTLAPSCTEHVIDISHSTKTISMNTFCGRAQASCLVVELQRW